MDTQYDLIIIGSGTAGLSAALYAGRYRMKVLVVGETFGGETVSAGIIENYPGVKELDGYELETIKTDALIKTNIDGIFAAGDAVNHFGSFKQDITAAALGAVAATSAYNDHKVRGELCGPHAMPAEAVTHV